MAPKKKATPRKREGSLMLEARLAALETMFDDDHKRLMGVQLSLVRHKERIQDAEGRITNGEQNVEFLSRADAEQRERLAKLERQMRTGETPLPVSKYDADALRVRVAEGKLEELRARLFAALNVINGTN